MIPLGEIKDYVQNTAEIIASVLDMDVVIVDAERYIMGDSDPWPDYSCVDDTSVLKTILETQQVLAFDSRDDNPGCLRCVKRHKCNVKSILGLPIVYKGESIGAVSICSTTTEGKRIMSERKDYFIQYTQQMSEQLISKLKERESNLQLRLLQKQLTCIINSIDKGIIATDENGRIIYYNDAVKEYFDPSELKKDPLFITDLLDETFFQGLTQSSGGYKNRESIITSRGKSIHAFITGKPVAMENGNAGAIILIKKISDFYREVAELSNAGVISGFDAILGSSPLMTALKLKASRIARGNSTVLIQGESGTGKELFARAIHNSSNVSDKPFVAVNCAAIPENLLESELFGYEEGAFTGAKKGGKMGKFQLADGGTIFLDEIGEMPYTTQAKLLRVLQERCVERVGGTSSIRINVRVIAATNRNLEELVAQKVFREDLYYRLNVIPLYIPPLRKRPEDISLLLYHFLSLYNRKLQRSIKGFTEEAEHAARQYDWKGNVRELQNAVEYAVNMADGEYIQLQDLNLSKGTRFLPEQDARSEIDSQAPLAGEVRSVDDIYKKQILDALTIYGTSVDGKKKAAEKLGISLATLYRKMKQFQL